MHSRTRLLVAAISSALVATALLAADAGAAPAKAHIAIYDLQEVAVPVDTGVLFGQVFSGRDECRSARPVKLMATVAGDADKALLDKGLSSAEGGISGLLTADEFGAADDIYFVAPKVKRRGKTICAQAKESYEMAVMPRSGAAKPVATDVAIVDIDGEGDDGAVAGVLNAGPGGRACLAGRKVSLLVDGDKTDRGTTTGRGAFALHITSAEAKGDASIKVKVKRSKLPSGKLCGAASAKVAEVP